jgi:hypothetical protein
MRAVAILKTCQNQIPPTALLYVMPLTLPRSKSEWTDEERAEIERIRAAYDGPECELECSHTDEGDPWCIIYDRNDHSVILHLARIDRRYFVVWPEQLRSVELATMKAAVDLIIAERGIETATCKKPRLK